MPRTVQSREAAIARPSRNVAKTMLQTTGFWLTFLLLIPLAILKFDQWSGLDRWSFHHPWAIATGVGLFVVAGALGLTSGVTMAIVGRGTPWPFDCPRDLVIAGPYRHVRNPMVVAGLLQGVAVGLFVGSPTVIVYSLLGAPVWNAFARPWEEADLERRFGDSFRDYRTSVRCWLPRWTPYQRLGEYE